MPDNTASSKSFKSTPNFKTYQRSHLPLPKFPLKKRLARWLAPPHRLAVENVDYYVFPVHLKERLEARLGRHLSAEQYILIVGALKQFFQAYALSTYQPVAMVSHAANALWQEFCHSKDDYRYFCEQVLGRTLTHPHEGQSGSYTLTVDMDNKELHRVVKTWSLCCQAQQRSSFKIYEQEPLAVLFELDKALGLYEEGIIWFGCEKDKLSFSEENPHIEIKNAFSIEILKTKELSFHKKEIVV